MISQKKKTWRENNRAWTHALYDGMRETRKRGQSEVSGARKGYRVFRQEGQVWLLFSSHTDMAAGDVQTFSFPSYHDGI